MQYSRFVASLVMVALLLVSVAAQAEEGSKKMRDRRFIAGVKASVLSVTENRQFYGGGFFFEFGVHKWVDLEASVRFLQEDITHKMTPVEILVKVPVRLGNHLQLFAGLGPAMVVDYNEDICGHFGMAVTAGTYLWLSQNWGFVLEFDYHLFGDDGARNEVGANLGLAFGW